MNDLMMDIETLDTKRSAIILQVAVVAFDQTTFEAVQCNNWYLDVTAQHGRTFGAATLAWWLTQSDAQDVIKQACGNGTKDFAEEFLQVMSRYQEQGIGQIWSQGSFDFDILESFLNYNGGTEPWKFYQKADLRTVMRFADRCGVDASQLRKDIRSKYTAHNALDDCMVQIEVLKELSQCLSLKPVLKPISDDSSPS